MIVAAMPPSTQTSVSGVRRDRSGAVTETLTSLLEAGERLYERAALIECPTGLAAFRLLHRHWVLGCLPVLARGFEPESVSEFLHANTRIPTDREPMLAARAAVDVMQDALELLRGLCATLRYDSGD
jgi:hypothetical protein